jgi:L-ribulose-5-phosphate 4-epimerase
MGLVLYTFGNASGMHRESGHVVIKPGGVPYEKMSPGDLVVAGPDGKAVEGKLRPSSDLATHLVLYRAFPEIGGVVHTHSRSATAWAQARTPIPCFGTTHADYFRGPIPVTPDLTSEEIEGNYERNTGDVLVRAIGGRSCLKVPAILVAGHAPFCWGRSASEAAYNAVVLEEIAALALATLAANPGAAPISHPLRDRHFCANTTPKATYGQA